MNFSPLFLRYSPILRFVIKEHSMEPAYEPGDTVIVVRFLKVGKGDVVIFKRDNIFYIKRVMKKSDTSFFVEGDNKKDSLHIGWIDKKDIIGKVIIKI
jgi:phage repressor protein C with HTH and peptisase S24 domain